VVNDREIDVSRYSFIGKLTKIASKPGFWLILALLLLITLPHYQETLQHPSFLTGMISGLGLTRHAFERVLYLAPVVWAGFMFGWRGAFITSLAALACMLPRAILISEYQTDALFESSAIFIIGNVLAISFNALRKEREYRLQLEVTHRELQASEARYRQLFENAHDAIWLHDLEGNFVAANRSAEKLSGYTAEELIKMNARDFLSEDSLKLAHEIRQKLLNSGSVDLYEQRIIRRDGSEAFVQLTTSLVYDEDIPVAFQHIARDITEQKQMQENLRFYLRQSTRAQEEERKRISHELHDESIQDLVVLSRQIDALTASEGMTESHRQRLEELLEKTNDIIQGIRRLSQDLRPAALDRLGLIPALEWLAADVAKFSGLNTNISVKDTPRRFPEEAELVLFRIVQEALRNVWRHANATKADITVEFDDNKTSLTIADNGQGFKLPQTPGNLAKDGKLGLAGMQERAQLIGATLKVQSEPGKGTRITVEMSE
jgi:PAS domain S-box-containing protein